MLFFTFILFFIYKTQKKTLLVPFVAIFIGFMFLYLAPGNFARLHTDFSVWLSLPLSEKVIFHLHRSQELVGEFFLVFATIIFSLFSFLVLNDGKKLNLQFFKFGFLFFVLAFFSVVIFAGSPTMMRRTLNTFNFFIILCASFSLHILLSQKNKNKAVFIRILFLVFVPYFTLSWASFTHAVSQIYTQAKIIDEVIEYAKKNGESKARIPEFYWTDLVRYSDVFGVGHHNPYMPSYYGIDEIIHLPVSFNYAIIKTQKPVLSQNLSDDLKLNLFYDNPPTAFRNARNLVFEFNQNLLEIADIGDSDLAIHLFLDDKDEILTMKLDDFLQIGNKFYYATELKMIVLEDIKTINLALYNPDTEQNSTSFSMDLTTIHE